MRVIVYMEDIVVAAGILHILQKENVRPMLIEYDKTKSENINQVHFASSDILIGCQTTVKVINEHFNFPSCRQLLILDNGNADTIVGFIEGKVTGIIFQQELSEYLNHAIILLNNTGYYFSPQITLKLAHNQSKFLMSKSLSKRELEIVDLLLDDASTADISSSLFLSPNTVSTHRKNIFRKLEIHNVEELKILFNKRV